MAVTIITNIAVVIVIVTDIATVNVMYYIWEHINVCWMLYEPISVCTIFWGHENDTFKFIIISLTSIEQNSKITFSY